MKKVFFIGDVALDEYYSAPYWPVLKDKVLLRTLEPQMGGSIANGPASMPHLEIPPLF